MTLNELYISIAKALPGERDILFELEKSTYVRINNNKLHFLTFVEEADRLIEKQFDINYEFPRFILIWKFEGRKLWIIEGAETEEELKIILEKKLESPSVSKIVRVAAETGEIAVLRNNVSVAE